MGQGTKLGFPFFESNPTCCQQDSKGQSRWAPDCSKLADSLLVSPDDETAYNTTSVASKRKLRPDTAALGGTIPFAQEAATVGSTVIREAMEKRGFHGETCKIVCASWRESTHKQYGSYLQKWKRFCVGKTLIPYTPLHPKS